MKLIKKTPGSVGEYVWKKAEDAVEVVDEFANELLGLAPHEFSVAAEKPASARSAAKKAAEKKPAVDAEASVDVTADTDAK